MTDSTEPPAAKRSKLDVPTQKQQSSLTSFFGGKPKESTKKTKETIADPDTNDSKVSSLVTGHALDPIIPALTLICSSSWRTHLDCIIIRHSRKERSRNKVAAFDLDGTLLVWRSPSWPSQLQHYELWNPSVFTVLQQRYDEGYMLLLVTNQGAIRKAFTGKNATRVKTLIEWIASRVNRPIHAIMSTNSKGGYHKPSKALWTIIEQEINGGMEFDISQSFYVGDSIEDNPDDPQGGVDSKFAKNVSEMKGTPLKFYTPDNYFGPSTASARKTSCEMAKHENPPTMSLITRAALSGGYVSGPILLVLCGVQGSGKSTFCSKLLGASPEKWVHLSQDTINNGKPGKREQVEAEARASIKQGNSVVVDRMHLDEEQRSHFVNVAKQAGVPVHALLLQPPNDVVLQRVRTRTNHPAGVEGDKGAQIASTSLGKVVVPCYKEGFDLISVVRSEQGVARLASSYKMVAGTIGTQLIPKSFSIAPDVVMPSIALGTMKIGKRIVNETISIAAAAGLQAFDTAPTYNNESELGESLKKDAFVIVKVPKRAVQPKDVRKELFASLSNLRRDNADLLLLHWPSDVISADTLKAVWQEMEALVHERFVRAIGVCNFNIDALRLLLPFCTIRPSVNQVERHPMLPQWDLYDFCCNQDIRLQAHTPLCQGSSELLGHSVIKEIANLNRLTPAQVVLQWNLQHGVAVIPKCVSQHHFNEVANVILGESSPLPPSSMKELDGLQERKRFVAPPFMYSPREIYAWGERILK